MLSILTTNVFCLKEQHLNFTISNLANQTYKDFEWIFCDSYYDDNKNIVKELCEKHKINFIHIPACGMNHVGSQWKWELYNNALLFSSRTYFVRFGVYRYMHRQTLEFIIKSITQDNIYVDQTQQWAPEEVMDFKGNLDEICNLSIMSDRITEQPDTHCGMFSMQRNIMVQCNNNEAIIRHHFEDAELNSRWRNTAFPKIKMRNLKNSFLRIDHAKVLDRQKIDGMKPCMESCCLVNFHGFYDRNVLPNDQIIKFEYRNHPWLMCPKCKIMSPAIVDDYFKHLESYKSYVAPIGINGILCRDIRILDEDLSKFTSLDSKVALLKTSHTEPRYLHDTE